MGIDGQLIFLEVVIYIYYFYIIVSLCKVNVL